MARKLILGIDFNNLLFGSYYGEKLINSKGINTNAIKGFFFKLKSLKDLFNPDYIVIASDLSRDRTFRRKLYKGYKAQRKSKDDDIITQLKIAQQLVDLLGYPRLFHELYEADDVLGMVSKYAKENDMDMVICSSDRDLYQLVNENVSIFNSRNKEIIDPGWMFEKYKLTPDQWIELKMLQGDNSDNIPGIDGVGEITALRLMHAYHNIDNIYNNLHQLKPIVQENLLKGKDFLSISRQLVTIVTDYNLIEFKPEMIERQTKHTNKIFDILLDLELKSLYNVMNFSLLLDKTDDVYF